MPTPITIRKATAIDIDLIRELSYKIWPTAYVSILSIEQIDYMMEMMYSKDSLLAQFQKGCQYFIIYDKQEPVGYASYNETNHAYYKLDKIYVLQQEQGKGIGKFAINYILNELRKNGALSLQLQVNRNNTKAKFFYEKLGFTVIEEADFSIGNGYFMNDYVMEIKP